MKKNKVYLLLVLHFFLLIYSLSSIFTKLAGRYSPISIRFWECIFLLGICSVIYAIGWQRVIKELPLTVAYANKAITVIWGLVLGTVFFGEKLSLGKCTGGIFVIIGIVFYTIKNKAENDE